MGPDSEAELLLAPFSRCEANMQYCASSLAATWSLRETVRKGIKDCKFQNAESREYILFMMLECTIVAAAANRVQSDVADHCKLEGDRTLQGFGVMFGYDYVASSLGPFADRFLSKTVESIGGITDVFGQQWSGTICQSCASCDKFDIQILLLGLENILNVVAESVAA